VRLVCSFNSRTRLNTIWNVPPPKASGVVAFIKKYFLSFSMVLGLGFLLLVSLLLEAGLAILGEFLKSLDAGAGSDRAGARFGGFVWNHHACWFAMLFKAPAGCQKWRGAMCGQARC